jgi:hypothetical protein
MRAIIDWLQNLSPALKDAMLTYVARLRTGRLITGLAAITLIAVGFSHFLAAYARGTTPAMMTTADPVILTIIEYIGLASTGMVALSPLIIYVVRRAVFRDFTRLIELGLARAEVDYLATTVTSGHRAWHVLLPNFWWHPGNRPKGLEGP